MIKELTDPNEILLQLGDEFVPGLRYALMDMEDVVRCDTLDILNTYVREGCGFSGAQEFVEVMGISYEEVIGKWFSFVDDSIMIYNDDGSVAV